MMDKRLKIAAMMMQGALSNPNCADAESSVFAKAALEDADALLAEHAKRAALDALSEEGQACDADGTITVQIKVPDEAKWIATDAWGVIISYEQMPTTETCTWMLADGSYQWLADTGIPCPHWQETLRRVK